MFQVRVCHKLQGLYVVDVWYYTLSNYSLTRAVPQEIDLVMGDRKTNMQSIRHLWNIVFSVTDYVYATGRNVLGCRILFISNLHKIMNGLRNITKPGNIPCKTSAKTRIMIKYQLPTLLVDNVLKQCFKWKDIVCTTNELVWRHINTSEKFGHAYKYIIALKNWCWHIVPCQTFVLFCISYSSKQAYVITGRIKLT